MYIVGRSPGGAAEGAGGGSVDKGHDLEGTGREEAQAAAPPPAEGGERPAMLACSDCGREQPHRVRYRNEAVAEMSCTVCGRTIALPRERSAGGDGTRDPEGDSGGAVASAVGLAAKGPRLARTVGTAAFDLSLRAATKPLRLWRQVRREGADALKTMPGRAATKPLRLARELQQDVGRKMREML